MCRNAAFGHALWQTVFAFATDFNTKGLPLPIAAAPRPFRAVQGQKAEENRPPARWL